MAINLENVLSSIGTIEELNNIQNYFNTVCENCRTKLIVESKAKELSSSPLLYLMEAFSSLSPELFATKQGRTIIRQYIDECRKNDAVKAVYTVYFVSGCFAKSRSYESVISERTDCTASMSRSSVHIATDSGIPPVT